MTADEFRAALLRWATAASPTGQAEFARILTRHGHPAADVARSVRRWAQIGPPAEVDVIIALLCER